LPCYNSNFKPMNLKSLVYLMLFLIYGLGCWRYYTCDIKGFCNKDKNALSTDIAASSAPIQFNKNTDSEVLFEFEKYCDSIKLLTVNSGIDVVGQYYADEANSTAFSNLGMARAHKLRDLLVACGVDSTKLTLIDQKIDGLFTNNIQVATEISPTQVVDMNSSEVQIVTNHGISEIYFPSNSTKEIKSETLDNFLKKTITDAGDKKIYLTGHTDNVGSEEANRSLSINRCIAIKDKMLKLGADPNQVICEGKGSIDPKVNNSTEENRALNRRVEVTIQ
jgi:outer membrane protein OmpA-like peptidoglycan-associated protein